MQRRGAIAAAKLDLDRDNVRGAAIWIRRAIVGALNDPYLQPEEIIDILTQYAKFLHGSRRFEQAKRLYIRLTPLYEKLYPPLAPKRITFLHDFLVFANDDGNIALADLIYDQLEEAVSRTDAAPLFVGSDMEFQRIYRRLRSANPDNRFKGEQELRAVAARDLDKMSEWSRIIYASFANRLARPLPEPLSHLLVPPLTKISSVPS